MLKLATILDNPGEPLAETRYRDPAELRALGYNGLVLYETTGLSGVAAPDEVASAEMRQWVQQQLDAVRSRIGRTCDAGLDVYIVYDVISLPRDVVQRDVSALSCKNRPGTLCPASEAALARSASALDTLLIELPGVAGVVLRFGDNDAARIPYLVGNDIYSPHCARCSHLGRADRIVALLQRFHSLVVEKRGQRLIARGWNVRPDGMHDSVDLAQRVAVRLPGRVDDDRLIVSFKFTQTDFWRYQRWNPSSLRFGRRPVMYELECQREFEGKGGIPNWQAPLWRDGPPEVKSDEPTGLLSAAEHVNLAGIWAWVRGGGWGGPFVENESWIDANVYAAPRLADDPRLDLDALGHDWVRDRLNITDPAVADAVYAILKHSPQVVLKGFYIGAYALGRARPWHPSADWIQDDLIDAQAAWRIVQQLSDIGLDDAAREKQEAAEQIARDRAALQQLVTDANRKQLEPLLNTLVYAESLFQTLRDLVVGLIAYRRYQRSKDPAAATLAKQRLLSAQSHWQTHTQHHGSLPGAATAFRENNLWDLTQKILAELQPE